MQVPHTEANSAFFAPAATAPAATAPAAATAAKDDNSRWIELFYSRPSWKVCQISYSTDTGKTWIPFGKYKLIDASFIKDGFRTFRIQADTLTFQFANSNASIKDTNNNKMYNVSAPGRYVVESGTGTRRVSDSQIADCLRPFRPNDSTIELTFAPSRTSSWPHAFVTYCVTGDGSNEWLTLPLNKSAVHPSSWLISIQAPLGIDCAFNDGASNWDSNDSKNYKIRLPGKYSIGDGYLTYNGVAQLDMHPAA